MKSKLALTLIFLCAALSATSNTNFSISKGILDLGTTSPVNLEPIKLQGEWEFYWNQLLTPAQLSDSTIEKSSMFVPVPKSWVSYKIDGEKLPNQGYATYRLVVKKRKDVDVTIYGLKVPSVFSSYKLWVNGKLITEVGTPDTNKETAKPQFKYQDVSFVLDPRVDSTSTIDIVFNVVNYSHQRAGLQQPIYLSTFKQLTAETRFMDILNLIIVGIILVIGINHLNMFFFRRKDRSNLYFSIVCLVMIFRNITTGDRILAYIFPNINWELLVKLDNLSGFGTIPLFALFIYSLFKTDFPKRVMQTLIVLGTVISLLVILTPANTYGKFRLLYELYILVGGLYLTFGVLLVATFRRRSAALPTFIGMFLLYATAINDVLSSMGIIQTAYLAQYGLGTFMLLQSITITRKSAVAINQNEKLSVELTHEKETLEQRIEERTTQLQAQHDELIMHQEKEKIQTWVNNGIALVNEIISQNKSDFKMLSNRALVDMIKYVDARVGAMFLADKDAEGNQILEMVANYGCGTDYKLANNVVYPGNGLVGATFADKEIRHITDVPDNYLKVSSGLGKSTPKSLLLIPMIYEEQAVGVVEIASFNEFTQAEINLLKRCADIVAGSIKTVRMNEENLNLIGQFKQQAELLQQKEENMRHSLNELEYYREMYEKFKAN